MSALGKHLEGRRPYHRRRRGTLVW